MKKIAFTFAICLAFLNGSACGRVGNLRPPEATAPGAVRFLTAEGKPEGILLRWQAPLEDASGGSIRGNILYRVERSDYQKGEVPEFTQIAEVLQESKKQDSPETKKAGNPFGGKQIPAGANVEQNYLDTTAQSGRRYDFRVIAMNDNGVKGRADSILRVTYAGEASRVESIAVLLEK